MRAGDQVTTPDGKGIIVAFEKFRFTERIGVKLDVNPFPFPIAYYFKSQIYPI